MTDIVKVLRGRYALDYDENTLDQFCNEAADEIERLRAALDDMIDLAEMLSGSLGQRTYRFRFDAARKALKGETCPP